MFSALVVGGCTKTGSTIGGAPGTAEDLERLRAVYAERDGNVVVGSVIGLLPEENLLAIGNVPVDRFFTGDNVSILDGNETTIAFARVVRRADGTVHASYTSQANARPPVEGDLVVRFPR